jgi:hypothetical protein
MANRYDVLAVSKYVDRNGDEKSLFTKLGTMFPNKNGETFSIELVALPISDKEGKVRLFVKPQEQRDGPSSVSRVVPGSASVIKLAHVNDVDDSIPF